METLSADMASMMSSKKSSASILDVVGADVNSSYDRAMQYQLLSDTFHVSAGGQTFGGNYNIQVQIRDDNAIHYLKNSGLVFNLQWENGAFVHSASQLFSGLELSIGNIVISTPFQHFYCVQKLTKKNPKKVQKYANGMALKISDFSVMQSYQEVNAGAGDASITSFVPLFTNGGVANPVVYTGINSTLSHVYHARHRQLADHFISRSEANVQRLKCFVPFHEIFPLINDLPDDGALFTGYGQSIKMNIRTNIAGDCLTNSINTNAAPSYSIQNMQLLKVFSKIDQSRTDLLLKSSITLPLCKYVHWQQQITTPVINAIYSVSKDDLITGLIFAFHTRTQSAASAIGSHALVNLTNNVAAQFKCPLSYFPVLPIQQIDLHIGGEPIILNAQQIQALHLLEGITGEDLLYQDPIMKQIKYAFKLDLRRFADDLYGSSAKQTTTVQIQLTLKQGADSKTLPLQTLDWNEEGAEFQNFSFYSYLETLSFMELKNGVYQVK